MGRAAGSGLAVLALVVLLVPASAGAAPFTVVHSLKVIAPYNGAKSSPSYSNSVTGCGRATIVTAPFFHPRSGGLGFSGSAASRGCPSAFGSSSSAYQSEYVTIPVPGLAGARHVDVKWTVHASGAESLHVGACTIRGGAGGPNTTTFSGCYADSYAYLSGYLYFYDTTNGSYYVPTNSSVLSLQASTSYYDYCYAGSCSSSNTSSGHASLAFNGAAVWHIPVRGLNASHHYELIAEFYGSEGSGAGSYGNATLGRTSATSWLNVGTFGNGATLDSIALW